MSTLTEQPTNPSFLSQLGFRFQLKKAPNLNFFVQSVEMPGLSLDQANVDTPFTKVPYPGTRLTFDNLRVTFKVDEDMKNYLEIFNWLKGIGFPDNFDQYRGPSMRKPVLNDNIFSDISLTILTSAMNPNISIDFYDCFPVDLSGFSLDSSSADVEYISATVTFAIRRFEVTPIA